MGNVLVYLQWKLSNNVVIKSDSICPGMHVLDLQCRKQAQKALKAIIRQQKLSDSRTQVSYASSFFFVRLQLGKTPYPAVSISLTRWWNEAHGYNGDVCDEMRIKALSEASIKFLHG